jgi:hypothetical protein
MDYALDHDCKYIFIKVHKDGTTSLPRTVMYKTLLPIGNVKVGESFVVTDYLPVELDDNTIEILGERIA